MRYSDEDFEIEPDSLAMWPQEMQVTCGEIEGPNEIDGAHLIIIRLAGIESPWGAQYRDEEALPEPTTRYIYMNMESLNLFGRVLNRYIVTHRLQSMMEQSQLGSLGGDNDAPRAE